MPQRNAHRTVPGDNLRWVDVYCRLSGLSYGTGLLRCSRCSTLEFLGKHQKDSAGPAQVGELVDVLVGGHATQRVVAVFCSNCQGIVDVVDGEGDAVHADFIRQGGFGLDRVRVDVLEEFEAPVAVRRLEHRDLGVVSVKADGGVGPFAADGVAAKDGEAKVGEEGDCCFEVANGNSDIIEFDRHVLKATKTDSATPVLLRGMATAWWCTAAEPTLESSIQPPHKAAAEVESVGQIEDLTEYRVCPFWDEFDSGKERCRKTNVGWDAFENEPFVRWRVSPWSLDGAAAEGGPEKRSAGQAEQKCKEGCSGDCRNADGDPQ